MKYLLKILILLSTVPYLVSAQSFCGSSCNAVLDVDTGNPTGGLQCTLPSLPSVKIDAIDVFEANGELKTYFGTGETVCDVLGRIDDAVPFTRWYCEL